MRQLLQQPFVIVQQAIISFLYAVPFIVGLLLASAGASLTICAAATKFALCEIPAVAERLSGEWTRRAIIAGFPYLWQPQLKKVFYGIAILAIVSGWLLVLFTLAFMMSRIF